MRNFFRKLLLFTFVTISFLLPFNLVPGFYNNSCFGFVEPPNPNYRPHLAKGSMIKVIPKIPYTTQNLEIDSPVFFIAAADVWVLEKKVIAKNDIFLGHVSMLKMPVQGVNAALKIDITGLKKMSGENMGVSYPLSGKIIFSSSDTLGGDLTNPLSYNTTIHPRRIYGNPWSGTLQYVPSGEYEFGGHLTLNFRDSFFVEILEDFYE